MSSQTFEKIKQKQSMSNSLVFGKRNESSPINKSDETVFKRSGREFGHDFASLKIEDNSFKQDSCPLNKAPSHCPFGGACHACPVGKQMSTGMRPGKALNETVTDGKEEKPSPEQGSATIQCDGSGGYEVVLNSWAGAPCGTESCVTAHENSHIADWKGKWPTGCKDKSKGYLPKGDPPDNPLMTVAEYNSFLKQSECTAHTVDLLCAEALPKTAECKQPVEDYISLTKRQRAQFCP